MTTDTLDFPPIEAAPPQTSMATSIAAAITPIDLTKIELTAVALAQYGDWRTALAETKANLRTLVLDLGTAAKIKEARALRQRLIGDPLAAARKVATGIKSKMAQTSKAVGAELEAIETGYTEADALILPKIEAREQELEREREEKERLERERIARHKSAIARIRAYAEKADTDPGMTSARVAVAIGQIEAIPTPTKEAWEEFAVPAADAICWTLERLKLTRERLLRAEQAEAEAAELRRKLAEAEAVRREQERQAQLQREADERKAAELAQAQALQVQQQSNEAAAQALVMGPAVASGAASTEYPQDGAQQVLKAEPTTADATDRAPTSASPCVGTMGAGQAADAAPAGGSPELRAAMECLERHPVRPFVTIEPKPVPADPDEKPTLKLGDLNDWLKNLSVSAAQLEAMGFPAHAERNAKLYKPSDKARIKAALIEWLQGLAS